MGGIPRKSRNVGNENVETVYSESRKENGGVRLGLAAGLGYIRYSVPLIDVKRRWWSIVLTVGRIKRRGKYCAYRT